jgi:hypothetical protein
MDGHRRRRPRIAAGAASLLFAVAACAGPTVSPPDSAAIATAIPATGTPTAPPATATVPALSPTPPVADRNPAAYVAGAPYAVTIDPADFVPVIDNPYWPLVPGTTTIFDGEGEHIVVKVTGYTKVVMGVPVTVVRDTAYAKGKVIEDTFDYYAQDRAGNVWYFGEDTTEFKNGKPTSTAGSWEAGVDGGLPGTVMLAQPKVGDVYRNEYYAGQAEDLSKVLEIGGTITVPAGAFTNTILTEDWTPLEPDQLERKTYAPSVGVVAEGPIDDPTVSKLVEVRGP